MGTKIVKQQSAEIFWFNAAMSALNQLKKAEEELVALNEKIRMLTSQCEITVLRIKECLNEGKAT